MEALVLSCSTGGGHNTAGKAAAKALEQLGWHTTFMDPYTLRSQSLANMVSGAYVEMVKHSPSLFGQVYHLGELYEKAESILPLPSPVLEAQRKTSRYLHDWLTQHPVDLIICSHPYPGMMLAILKREGIPLPPSIMIATDYTCIPFETQVGCDWMVIGSEKLAQEFIQKGVLASSILPFGIPVDDKFETRIDRMNALRRLDLSPCYRYLLVASGSMGSKGTWPLIEQLKGCLQQDPDVRLLILTGTNEQLFERIRKLHNPRIQPVSFTEHVEDYLAVCCAYITKPGGLSITEAAAYGVPLLLAGAIPGCESRNALFFENNQMASYIRHPEDLCRALHTLLKPENQARMIHAQQANLPHQSARALASFCTRLIKEKASQAISLHEHNSIHSNSSLVDPLPESKTED